MYSIFCLCVAKLVGCFVYLSGIHHRQTCDPWKFNKTETMTLLCWFAVSHMYHWGGVTAMTDPESCFRTGSYPLFMHSHSRAWHACWPLQRRVCSNTPKSLSIFSGMSDLDASLCSTFLHLTIWGQCFLVPAEIILSDELPPSSDLPPRLAGRNSPSHLHIWL